MKSLIIYGIALAAVFEFNASYAFLSNPKNWNQAVDAAVKRYGLRTEPELKRFFSQAHVSYPPQKMAILAFKEEREVQLWAKNSNQTWTYIHSYALTAYSGQLGPKLKENDLQIPEGIYTIKGFNPYSSMHLSMMINYPNAFDRKKAAQEGRTQLGDNIFIHGRAESVGCLAIGDHAIDQLFLLSRKVGLKNIRLIIAPNDLRSKKAATKLSNQPKWVPELYQKIEQALLQFPHRKQTT